MALGKKYFVLHDYTKNRIKVLLEAIECIFFNALPARFY